METAIQFAVGASLTVLGASCFFRTKDWIAWINDIRAQGREILLPLGALHILLGSLVVGFHPLWSGWPLVVTLIGVWAMLEGMVYLLLPAWAHRKLKFLGRLNMRAVLMFMGVFMVIIGVGTLNYVCTGVDPSAYERLDLVMRAPQ